MRARLTTFHNASGTRVLTAPVSGRKPVLALLMRLLWAAALALPAFGAKAGVVFTSLCSFQVSLNGAYPAAGLVQGSDGNFYGTTYKGGTNGFSGTVFKISTNGTLTSLYSFTVGNDGANPYAGLVQGSDGYFYGTTEYGGAHTDQYGQSYSTVFKISPNGVLTSLYSFSGGNDGAYPYAGLVQGSDGNFYGTTAYGGSDTGQAGSGTVFKVRPNGALTTLYSFSGGSDGANPSADLVQGSDGCFYGTTLYGGQGGAGTVFRLTIVPEPPQLTITPAGANVILTWPTNFIGFTLESTTNLGSSVVWTPVSLSPVVVTGQNTVTNAISGAQQFYRLSQYPQRTTNENAHQTSLPTARTDRRSWLDNAGWTGDGTGLYDPAHFHWRQRRS